MNRRNFLTSSFILAAAAALPVRAQTGRPPMRTRWNVVQSEGFDAIAFLGALGRQAIYLDHYSADAAAFGPKLPPAILGDIARLHDDAQKAGFGLLWPGLCSVISGATITTLDSVIAALAGPDTRIKPAYRASSNWDAGDWAWVAANAPRLRQIFVAMRDAGFGTFRRDHLGLDGDARLSEVARALACYDVVRWQEKLTGRKFDPTITIVLMRYSKPHGVKVQGQKFLQAFDYDTATTVRIAAHEMLHPPMPMNGAAAKAAMAVLGKDSLITRIVRDHDPKWGYTSLEGLLNEDICEALDQLISEALGVARNPADRWRKADDGIHVLAAGLYGLLRSDRWVETGGDIEQWLARSVAAGRLAPATLHRTAAQVLERPADRLWPLQPAPAGA